MRRLMPGPGLLAGAIAMAGLGRRLLLPWGASAAESRAAEAMTLGDNDDDDDNHDEEDEKEDDVGRCGW